MKIENSQEFIWFLQDVKTYHEQYWDEFIKTFTPIVNRVWERAESSWSFTAIDKKCDPYGIEFIPMWQYKKRRYRHALYSLDESWQYYPKYDGYDVVVPGKGVFEIRYGKSFLLFALEALNGQYD